MIDMAEVFADMAGPLTAYFSRRLSPAQLHLAEDLMMETMTRAVKAAPRYEDRGVSVKPWLWQIAANLLTDHRRLTANRPSVPFKLDLHDGAHVDRDLETAADRVTLEIILTRLTPEQQTVMALFYWRGMTEIQVSAQSGLSVESAKKRKYRALGQMRKILEAA